MVEEPAMSAASETPCTPATYRALIMRADGEVVGTQTLIAADDDEACALAEAMVDGHAVEL